MSLSLSLPPSSSSSRPRHTIFGTAEPIANNKHNVGSSYLMTVGAGLIMGRGYSCLQRRHTRRLAGGRTTQTRTGISHHITSHHIAMQCPFLLSLFLFCFIILFLCLFLCLARALSPFPTPFLFSLISLRCSLRRSCSCSCSATV